MAVSNAVRICARPGCGRQLPIGRRVYCCDPCAEAMKHQRAVRLKAAPSARTGGGRMFAARLLAEAIMDARSKHRNKLKRDRERAVRNYLKSDAAEIVCIAYGLTTEEQAEQLMRLVNGIGDAQ